MLLFSCVEISDLCIANICNYITTKIKYGLPAIILIVAFVIFVVICWRLARKRRGKARRVFERSMSLGVLHGGKLALERLVDYHKARADATVLDAAEVEMDRLLAKKHPNFIKLQIILRIIVKNSSLLRIREIDGVDVGRFGRRKKGLPTDGSIFIGVLLSLKNMLCTQPERSWSSHILALPAAIEEEASSFPTPDSSVVHRGLSFRDWVREDGLPTARKVGLGEEGREKNGGEMVSQNVMSFWLFRNPK